jgi:hypothetical protein
MRTLTFFIFAPPEFFNFLLKAEQEVLIASELDLFDLAHKVAVVVVVTVVISQHTAVIGWANPWVDVGEAVLYNFACLVPNLFLKHGATPST